jgi:hypothetical protein
MAIKKEEFFQIIKKVSESDGLSQDNLLTKIKDELHKKDEGEYSKFDLDFYENHLFSIKISDEAAKDWTLLYLIVACNDLFILELLLKKEKISVNTRVKDGSKDDGPTALHIAASYGHEDMIKRLLTDDQVDPLLKSKNKTPREMIGNIQNRDDIAKMLEKAEQSYAKAEAKKNPANRGDTPLQPNNKTPEDLVVNRSNVTAVLENNESNSNNKRPLFSRTIYVSLIAASIAGSILISLLGHSFYQ